MSGSIGSGRSPVNASQAVETTVVPIGQVGASAGLAHPDPAPGGGPDVQRAISMFARTS